MCIGQTKCVTFIAGASRFMTSVHCDREQRVPDGIALYLISNVALADASIRAADPRSILRQGYVLALDSDGTVLKNVSSKSAGDSFALKFMDGMWGCMINDVKQDAVGNGAADRS